MKIAVVLGNRINNDGTITKAMAKRIELAKRLYDDIKPDYIIVSGGVANKKAGISEAEVMYNKLVELNVPKEILIKEDKSRTTNENALFSIPLAKEKKADTIIICSSHEHFTQPYNVLTIFNKAINDSSVNLMVYTDCYTK